MPVTDAPAASTPELSILLVNWNTREMTLDCLRSVVEQTTQTDYEIIVVDNGSHDGSAEAIRAAFPEVRLIALEDNLGFGRATNLQAREARGHKLLLLNTDTVVLDGAIDKLVAFARAHPEAGIWGGRTLYADGTLNPTSCWGKQTAWNCLAGAVGLAALFPGSALFNSPAYPGWPRDSVREVDIVTGCLLMIDRARWEELGGFDPHFFMFGEEADLCLRAKAGGARPVITPDATIIHYDGASNRNLELKRVYTLSSRIGLIERHIPAPGKYLARWAVILGVGLRALGYGLAAKLAPARFAQGGALWRAVWRRRGEWRGGPISAELQG